LILLCIFDNSLDIAPLKFFVDILSSINPLMKNYDRYSKFPEAAKLVYSICIITIPLQILLIHKIWGSQFIRSSNKKTLDELHVGYGVLIFVFIISILNLYIAPISEHATFCEYYQISKEVFSIITALDFFFTVLMASILISHRKMIQDLKKIINTNVKETDI
jgi:hypothetical protein